MPASPEQVDACLAQLLAAWHAEVTAKPVPSLIDPLHAAEVIAGARRMHAPPDGARTRRCAQDNERGQA